MRTYRAICSAIAAVICPCLLLSACAGSSRGSGLIGLSDRVQALGGKISISSPAGAGTKMVAELPLDDRQQPPG